MRGQRPMGEIVSPDVKKDSPGIPAGRPSELIYWSQTTCKQIREVRGPQRVFAIAIQASELSPSGFDRHEPHRLVAFGTEGRRGVFDHDTHAQPGASLLLTVTICCRGRGGDIPHMGV